MPSRAELEMLRAHQRIRELEEIIRAKDGFLQELYAAAGFRIGEQVSMSALIARIRKWKSN